MILRPVTGASDKFRVIGTCYVDGLVTGEAVLGPLPSGYRMSLRYDEIDKVTYNAWENELDGTKQWEDPRWRIHLGDDYAERIGLDPSRRYLSGEKWQLIDEVLRIRGIKTQTIKLV